jgi:hypothetical protein
MKKLQTILLLALFLVILPAGSWLYLKKGFNYRKQIIKDLENKTPFTDSLFTYDSVYIDYKNRCTVLSLNEDEKITRDIFRQFKEAKGFQLVGIDSSNVFRQEFKKNNTEIDAIINTSYKQIDKKLQEKLKAKFNGKDFVIIDSLNQIRNTYTLNDITKLINHIPALLPYFDEKKNNK